MLSSNESGRIRILFVTVVILAAVAAALVVVNATHAQGISIRSQGSIPAGKIKNRKPRNFDAQIVAYANQLFEEGRNTFRLDTFGDEAFWGGSLKLHEAIKGANLGGVGPGISPATALSLGLKVDVDALPQPLINRLRQGRVNLDDPATTVALLKLDAVVGIRGFFEGDDLNAIGITCAICHSTVDNSLAFGIGHRRRRVSEVASLEKREERYDTLTVTLFSWTYD